MAEVAWNKLDIAVDKERIKELLSLKDPFCEHNRIKSNCQMCGRQTSNVSDQINPDHYKVGGIETIEFIEAKLSPEEFAGYCRGNAMKYISRAGHKDVTAIEIGKAIWYLQRWRDSLLHTDTPT